MGLFSSLRGPKWAASRRNVTPSAPLPFAPKVSFRLLVSSSFFFLAARRRLCLPFPAFCSAPLNTNELSTMSSLMPCRAAAAAAADTHTWMEGETTGPQSEKENFAGGFLSFPLFAPPLSLSPSVY